MKILALNAGSSSLRARLVGFKNRDAGVHEDLWRAHVVWDQDHKTSVQVWPKNGNGAAQAYPGSLAELLPALLSPIWSGSASIIDSNTEIHTVGHRIVHGGGKYGDSVDINETVLNELAALGTVAPLHNRVAIEVVRILQELLPSADQVAVFDTGFHTTLPDAAKTYPGPYEWLAQGIYRYGFHGTSHRYAARRTAEILNRPLKALRIVTCHLGSGASLAAIVSGTSIDTTMGFTPMEGLMMSTRSGSIDPGIVLHLLRHENRSADEVETMLNEESGLK
ncbi:MAG: acetate/propionate family kinase, partial [Bryobacteraceae bacterium]